LERRRSRYGCIQGCEGRPGDWPRGVREDTSTSLGVQLVDVLKPEHLEDQQYDERIFDDVYEGK